MDCLIPHDASLEQLRLKKEAAEAQFATYPSHAWLQAEAIWAAGRYARALAEQQPQDRGLELQAA